MQKKFGTRLLALVLALLTLSGCARLTDTAPAEETAAPTPKAETSAYADYDAAQLRDWIYSGAQRRRTSLSRKYSLANTSYQQVREDLKAILQELFDGDLFFIYTVEQLDFDTPYHKDYVEIELWYTYAENETPFEELPRAASEAEILRLLEPALSGQKRQFAVLLPYAAEKADAANIAEMLATNDTGLAAGFEEYRYRVLRSAEDRESLIDIVLVDPVDREQLDAASAEMCTALDRMAEELRESGETDRRALYLAAGRQIMDAADYAWDLYRAKNDESVTLTPEQRLLDSPYGAVVAGQTVCGGYARAYKALCDRLGLDCWVVAGQQRTGSHAWNAIALGGETLYMDCTYADSDGDESYFFMREEQLASWGYVPTEGWIIPWE